MNTLGKVREARRGLSLLEVILAIAILGGAMATIGQLIRIGSRNAAAARDLTLAQIYCESTLNEVAAGAVPLDAASDVPLDELGEWLYTVESSAIDEGGLIELRVTVRQSEDAAARPASYTLTRWMIDPAVAEAAAAEEAAMKEQAAAAAAQGEENAAAGAGTPDPNAATGGQPGGGNLPGGTGGQPGPGQGQPGVPGAPGGFGNGRPNGPGGPGGPGAPDGGQDGGRGGRGTRGGRGGFGGGLGGPRGGGFGGGFGGPRGGAGGQNGPGSGGPGGPGGNRGP